jgi:site-specific DNA recombinase
MANRNTGAEHTTKLRTALYARVSPTGDQEPDANFSIPSQLRPMRERVRKEGWLSGPELEFTDEHFSGKDLNRPAMSRLRKMIRDREVDVVLIYTLDRLARRMAHQLIFLEEAQKCGVRIEFIQAHFEDTPEGRMMRNVLGAFAEFEREKIRERTSRGRREKAEAGFITTAVPPYGYAYVKGERGKRGDKGERKRGAWVINDQERPWLQKIFELAAAGYGQRGICRYFLENGIKPRRAAKWAPETIREIVANPTYKGRAACNSLEAVEPQKRRNPEARGMACRPRPEAEWIWVEVPRLISDDLWQQANDRMVGAYASKVGKPTTKNLLSGHLWCSACGKRCRAKSIRGRSYYHCDYRDRVTGEWLCPARRHARATVIEPVAWDAIMDHLTSPALLAEVLAECRRPNDLNRERREKLEAEMRKCDIVMSRAQGKILDPNFSDDLAPWEKALLAAKNRKKQLQAELNLLAAKLVPDVPMAILERIAALYAKHRRDFRFALRRKTLARLVERIVFYAEAQEIEIRVRVPVNAVDHSAELLPNCQYSRANTDDTATPVSSSFCFTIKRRLEAA